MASNNIQHFNATASGSAPMTADDVQHHGQEVGNPPYFVGLGVDGTGRAPPEPRREPRRGVQEDTQPLLENQQPPPQPQGNKTTISCA